MALSLVEQAEAMDQIQRYLDEHEGFMQLSWVLVWIWLDSLDGRIDSFVGLWRLVSGLF